MKKNSNSQMKSGPKTRPAKSCGPVPWDSKEVMAELVAKLSERLGPQPAQEQAAGGTPQDAPQQGPGPNRNRLTVGVDWGDPWSHYCILGLEGETLGEGQWRTRREDVAEFFQA